MNRLSDQVKNLSIAKRIGFSLSALLVMIASLLNAQDTLLLDYLYLSYPVNSVAADSLGQIWISGARGLEKYNFRKERFDLVNDKTFGLIVPHEGEVVYVGEVPEYSDNQNYYNLHKNWFNFVENEHNRVTVAKDFNGIFWVCNGKGLYRFRVRNLFKNHLPGKSTRGIYYYWNFLFVNTYGGIFRNGETILPDILQADGEIFPMKDKLLILEGDIYECDQNQACKALLPVPIRTRGFEDRNPEINEFARAGVFINDTLWLGLNKGLGWWTKGDTINGFGPHAEFIRMKVFDDKIFAISPKSGVFVINQGEVKVIEGTSEWEVYDVLCSSSTGFLFFATKYGLYIWDPMDQKLVRKLTRADGLNSDLLFNILEDNEGNIWVSSFSGINVVDKGGKKVLATFLHEIEFNRSSAVKVGNKMFFGSINGVYEIDATLDLSDYLELNSNKKNYFLIGLYTLIGFLLVMISFLIWQNHHFKLKMKELEGGSLQEETFIQDLENYVLQHIEAVTIEDLVAHTGLSRRTLYRKFLENNIRPGEFVRDIRLNKAKEILTQYPGDIAFAAESVGYSEKHLLRLLKE